MNLVTAQRTNQQVLTSLEIQVGKVQDHVEDVDEHLRGVAGQPSLDTRVAIMENEIRAHGVLLRHISDQFGGLEKLLSKDMAEIKAELSAIKMMDAMQEKAEQTKSERFKEWLKFWGPIVLATLALIVPLAKLTFDNWEKIEAAFSKKYDAKTNVDRWMSEIEKRKRDPKTKLLLKERYGVDGE